MAQHPPNPPPPPKNLSAYIFGDVFVVLMTESANLTSKSSRVSLLLL